MSKIDTSNWANFKLSELFGGAQRGNIKSLQTLPDGNVPVIAAGAYNQGIAGYYKVKPEYCNQITISCNGAGCGSTFYHDYPFNINGDAIVLIEKIELSEYAKKFIACMINGVFTRKYSYEEKCSGAKALDETIRLPATKENLPDFAYMEYYMRSLEDSVSTRLTALQSAQVAKKKKIDVGKWREFDYRDIFELQIIKEKLGAVDLCDDGLVPVYSSCSENGGIVGYTNNQPSFCVSSNAPMYLVFGDHTKAMNIATSNFCTMDNVKILKPKTNNTNVILFICAVWKRCIPDLGYARHWGVAQKTKIPLPVTDDGNPDWEFMEQYIEKIEMQAKSSVEAILNDNERGMAIANV